MIPGWSFLRRVSGVAPALLLLALIVRLLAFNWDAGLLFSPHPDERHVVTMSEKVDSWFVDPEFFAYGTLHFQCVRLATWFAGMQPSWQALTLGSRILSLLASMVTLLVAMWMAKKAWGRRTALLFLGLAAFVPLLIQLSHFGTVEAHHAMWVTVCLAASFQLARTSRQGWAAASGAACAASLAVKVSSLALGLPLAAALLMIGLRRGAHRAFALAGAMAATGLCAFWLGQPWTFADARPPVLAVLLAVAAWGIGSRHATRLATGSAALCLAAAVVSVLCSLQGFGYGWTKGLTGEVNPGFIRGVSEQVDMVTGEADMPYVRVYRGTLPFVFAARELALWGVGPAVFSLALWAVIRACVALWRRRHRVVKGRLNDGMILVLFLLLWLAPTSLRLATLQVKFLRYWEPLIVPMLLLGAWAVVRLQSRWRRPVALASLIVTGVWGASYLWAFVDPHPFVTAGSWLKDVVAEDQVVAWEHWDEHIGDVALFERTLASYDLPDDDAKIARWCQSLAGADWVVLTSNRVRRTVYRNPDRFPRTSRLYRLLMAGEAGFEIAGTASRGPRFFGFELPVQGADESFVNYEFPRVVALRRVAEVDARELARRSAAPIAGESAIHAEKFDRQLLSGAPRIRSAPRLKTQAASVVAWILVFGVMGLSAWVVLLPLLRGWPDGGLGLAIVTGWMLPPWLMWLLSFAGMPVGPGTATGLLAGFGCACGFVAWKRWPTVRRVARIRWRGMLAVGLTFVAIFVLFLVVRLGNPAIYWGEKPMDFSFFNAFVSTQAWPPGEPWMAGMALHYYYFGNVLMAFPTLLTAIDPAVGYNLACATAPALSGAPLLAFALLIARRRRRTFAWLLPGGALLMGNLAWPWLFDLALSARWFDLWWATSRVVPGYAITEYPLWTALFADLHAHWVAQPVMIAALLWAMVTVGRRSSSWLAAAALCGWSVAVLAATNPWDIVIFTSALAMVTVAAARRPLTGLWRLSVAAGVCLATSVPFIFELESWLGGGEGIGGRPLLFLTPADFAPWWAVLRHFGVFVIPLAAMAVVRPKRDLVFAAALAVAGVAAGLSFGSSAAALSLALAMVFLTQFRWAADRWLTAAWAAAGLAMLAVAFADRVTLLDRMNTVFKIYNGVWLLLVMALGLILLRERGLRWRVGAWTALPLAAIATLNLPLGILQGWSQPRMSSPRPTLDGRAFLASNRASDEFLIRVLRGSSRPGEVVAEAAGQAYGDFTRIAMHTGLPTVVGWEWHLRQRGQSQGEIEGRVADLEILYRGGSPGLKREVLDRYDVRWVVFGDVERKAYGLGKLDPFRGVKGVVPWATDGRSTVYRVIGGD